VPAAHTMRQARQRGLRLSCMCKLRCIILRLQPLLGTPSHHCSAGATKKNNLRCCCINLVHIKVNA
jgi:hypothetical protein